MPQSYAIDSGFRKFLATRFFGGTVWAYISRQSFNREKEAMKPEVKQKVHTGFKGPPAFDSRSQMEFADN